jgi:hypothetical protein
MRTLSVLQSCPPTDILSAFLFRLIVAHVAELARPFDEAALPVCALLNGCGLIAERVNRSPCQLRGLASASSFGGPRWQGGSKGPIDQSADCFGASRSIDLFLAPIVESGRLFGQ